MITEEGRKTRFERWERLGLDRVKHDLLNGGYHLIGGPPEVRELAWEWVRAKEEEQAKAAQHKESTTMARNAAVQKPPTLPLDRALTALTKQLGALQKLKGRKYQEAQSEKSGWEQLTQSVIEAAYGDPSSELTRFHQARAAGSYSYNVTGNTAGQQQNNFDAEVGALDVLLQALLPALRLHLPEEEIKGIYQPGDEYAFYRDLSSLIQAATQDVLFVDAYIDDKVFDLYVSKVAPGAKVRILSNNVSPKVVTLAQMYAKGSPLELRSSKDIHDRAIFLDQRGWVTGQSIKDAAKKKPTYLIELDEPLLTASRDVHNGIWKAATAMI